MGGVAGALACLFFAIPFLASTQIVSARITGELAALSGMRVTMAGVPVIRVWPSFAAVLTKPSMHARTDPGAAPVMEMRSATLAIDPFAALSGKVRITGLTLEEPILHLDRLAPGDINLGGIGNMILASQARLAGQAGGGRGKDPKPAAWTARMPQVITFANGRIEPGGNLASADSVTGKITIQPSSGRTKMQASMVWNGLAADISLKIADYLALLAGSETELEFDGKSQAGEISFDGKAAFGGDGLIDGVLDADMESLQAGMDWLAIQGTGAADRFHLSASVSGNQTKAVFGNLVLGLGQGRARGALEYGGAGGARSLSGTLAFDTLDLGIFLPFAEESLKNAPPAGGNLFNKLDLRISAATASLFGLEMTGLASSATLADGRASFLISEAAAFGGTLMAGLRRESENCTAFLTASGMDAGAAESALIGRNSLTSASLDASLSLAGPFEGWKSYLAGAEGEFSATLGEGMLAAPDIKAFKALVQESGFFGMSGIGHTAQPTRGGVMSATIKDGIAQIGTAEIVLDKERIVLRGVTHLGDRSLALTGAIDPGDGEPALPFFAGGSWRSPFISPQSKP